MKYLSNKKLYIVFFVLIIYFSVIYASIPYNSKINKNDFSLEISGRVTVNPFVIDNTGGGDYTWAQIKSQPWCSGSGTETDPYLISNIEIDGLNHDYCISIQYSNAYFNIENCNFYNAKRSGIHLESITNGKISKNTIYNNDECGISLYDIRIVELSSNTIKNNLHNGITINRGSYNNIMKNTIENNYQNGIIITFSEKNNLSSNNIIKNSQNGIKLIDSENNSLTGNDLVWNGNSGIELEHSHNNHLEKNRLYQNVGVGINLVFSSNNLIKENEFVYNSQTIVEYRSYSNDILDNIGYSGQGEEFENFMFLILLGILFIIAALIIFALIIHLKEKKRYNEFIKKTRIDTSTI